MAEPRVSMHDLAAMPEADLRAQVEKLRQELWQARLKAKDGSLQQTHLLSARRRQIARVLTALRQQAKAKGSP